VRFQGMIKVGIERSDCRRIRCSGWDESRSTQRGRVVNSSKEEIGAGTKQGWRTPYIGWLNKLPPS
jgi:hypothetical protein